MHRLLPILGLAVALAAPAVAATPRDTLTQVAFQATDKAVALGQVKAAIAAADAALAKDPRDRELLLQRAIGIGYRAKLSRSRTDAKLSRGLFEALAASDPRDAEAQLAVAGWHLDAIAELGAFLARTGLGAQRAAGEAALDRAVAVANNRALILGLAAMLRIRLDHNDIPRVRRLAEAAAQGTTATPLDRLIKRDAAALLGFLQKGDGKAAQALAKRLLPFGRLKE